MAKATKAPLPYEFLPQVSAFSVNSDSVADGKPLGLDQLYNGMGLAGNNKSPDLRWEAFPSETRSFAVTCFDPDAPTGSGFWHWVLFDIPASVTELPAGAGSGGPGLTSGAVHARNDMGTHDYAGAAPPEGHPPHRYVFAVHALDVDKLGLDENASPAFVGFNLTFHTLGRGLIIPEFGR